MSVADSVRLACERVGGVELCAKLACLAVVRNVEIDNLTCPNCNTPHLDELHLQPHVKHTCKLCNTIFKHSRPSIGNPLVTILR